MAFHEVGSPLFPIAQERDEFGDIIDLGMAAEQFGGAGRRSGASIEQRDIDFASGEGLIEDWKIADNQGEEPKSGNCFKDGDGAGGWRDGSNVSQAQSAKSASAHIHGSPEPRTTGTSLESGSNRPMQHRKSQDQNEGPDH